MPIVIRENLFSADYKLNGIDQVLPFRGGRIGVTPILLKLEKRGAHWKMLGREDPTTTWRLREVDGKNFSSEVEVETEVQL